MGSSGLTTCHHYKHLEKPSGGKFSAVISEMSWDEVSVQRGKLREDREIQMTPETFCWNKNFSQAKRTALLLKKEMLSKAPSPRLSARRRKHGGRAVRAPCVAGLNSMKVLSLLQNVGRDSSRRGHLPQIHPWRRLEAGQTPLHLPPTSAPASVLTQGGRLLGVREALLGRGVPPRQPRCEINTDTVL